MQGEGLSVLNPRGTRTRLKWHRLRRTRDDIPFTPARLAEGLRLGASLEVDLQPHGGEAGFAVLHDDTLERETTGAGAVAGTDATALSALALRGPGGAASAERVLLLDGLCALIRAGTAHPGVRVQLDLKASADQLTASHIWSFARAVSPVAGHMILSGGDASAVARLAAAVPGLATGFDPCDDHTPQRIAGGADIDEFAASALAAAPAAAMIYLDYRAVLAALDRGRDLVAMFQQAGREVDAWTLNASDPGAAHALQRLLSLGVDQITTDEPLVMERLAEPPLTPR